MTNDLELNLAAPGPRRSSRRTSADRSTSPSSSTDSPASASDPTAPVPIFRLLLWVPMLSLAAILSALLTWRLHLPHGLFLPCLAVVICAVAAWTDATTARIPNRLTYPALLIGVFGNLIASLLAVSKSHALLTVASLLGSVGAANSLAGAGICLVIGIACMLLPIGGSNAMGGGDLKLIVALGAFLGLSGAPLVLILSLAIAVPLALLNLVFAGGINRLLQSVALQVATLIYTARPMRTELPLSGRTIPLAIPLACGLFLALVWPNNPIAAFLGM